MAKNPERDAFRQSDQLNDGKADKADEASKRLSLEANALQAHDKVSPKVEELKVTDGSDSVANTLAAFEASLSRVGNLFATLPPDLQEQVLANNADHPHGTLLKAAREFPLVDSDQNPQRIRALIAEMEKTVSS